MKYLYPMLPMIILIMGCNSSNRTEKEYIKNLEEKNRLLELEIAELKNDLQKNDSNNTVIVTSSKQNINDYFTIGSTEKKVLEVMGTPTSLRELGPIKIMDFGLSTVKFENGKVIGFDNFDGNLKVKLTE